jgi:hypothetical protein
MPTVKLDRERTLRFDFNAFITLDEVCKINVYALDMRTLSPLQIRDLVWCAQLHTDKPLTRERVGKYLPTTIEEMLEVRKALIDAISESYGAGDDQKAPGA